MKRVLVADDDPDCRYLLECALESAYDMQSVSDGPSALALLETWKADVVILDLLLPAGPGNALVSEIRRRCSARILAFSGSDELTSEELELFDEVILEPARPSAVLGAVNRLLGSICPETRAPRRQE